MPAPTPKSKTLNSTKFEQLKEDDIDLAQEIKAIVSDAEKDADTRQAVTKKFVRYYFALLTVIIVGVPIYNYFVFRLTGKPDLIIPFKDAILTYSAVVGPTVGLVVAYYFKSKPE